MTIQVNNIKNQSPLKAETNLPTAKKKHYVTPGIVSLVLPGTGQFMKGDNKRGWIDTGIWTALLLARMTVAKKGIAKTAVSLGFVANHITSAINAYNAPAPEKTQKPKTETK